jgi:DNA-binding response OmpR family regulator
MTSHKRLLVIDDDARLRELLVEYLSQRGFAVEAVGTARDALDRLRRPGVDLAIVDVMLPDQDGFELVRALRAFSRLPAIMLTARGDETDRIVGLEMGADDYLPKPFNPRELLARIQAVLRRADPGPPDSPVLVAGPIHVDVDQRVARVRGERVDLTTTEFELLRTLVAHAGRTIPREKLMALARGEAWANFDRSVDVHVSHLRKKLGTDTHGEWLIKTVRGVGYMIPRGEETGA